jgi:hypothetical protein
MVGFCVVSVELLCTVVYKICKLRHIMIQRAMHSIPVDAYVVDRVRNVWQSGGITCRRRVSLESLNGVCLELRSARELMQMPRVVSDRLMALASVALKPVHRRDKSTDLLLLGTRSFV